MSVVRGVVAAGLALAMLVGLAELTQNRPDPIRADTVSRVVVDLSVRGGEASVDDAFALWAVCRRTASHVDLAAPVAALPGGDYELLVHPALGEHDEKRFVGCLEDATLDRVVAHVRAIEDVPAATVAG